MANLKDHTNHIFGELTVLYRDGRNKDLKPTWVCRCSCGNIVIKTGKYLRKNKDPYLNCGLDHPKKVCSICKINKLKSEYHACATNKNRISSVCKICKADFYVENKAVLKRKWHSNIKDPEFRQKRLITIKKSYYKNIESQKAYKKIYTKKPEVIARAKEIHEYRKENDLGYKIKLRIRWRLRDVIRKIGKDNKYKSSLFLLGCDGVFFKNYIENKFVDGMCWERISEIHLDHIKPLSLFDLTDLEQQKIAFHYSNVQPLWARDNHIKNNKYPYVVPKSQSQE